MAFTPDGERQSSLLIFNSFLVISNKSYKNRKVSLTIHWKYKYFDSTVQRAEDRRQKFHFCRLPSAVNVMLNLSIGTKAMLSDVNTAFRWNPALRLNTHPSPHPRGFNRRLRSYIKTWSTSYLFKQFQFTIFSTNHIRSWSFILNERDCVTAGRSESDQSCFLWLFSLFSARRKFHFHCQYQCRSGPSACKFHLKKGTFHSMKAATTFITYPTKTTFCCFCWPRKSAFPPLCICYFSKVQLVVYYQCFVLIGWSTSRLFVIAH